MQLEAASREADEGTGGGNGRRKSQQQENAHPVPRRRRRERAERVRVPAPTDAVVTLEAGFEACSPSRPIGTQRDEIDGDDVHGKNIAHLLIKQSFGNEALGNRNGST